MRRRAGQVRHRADALAAAGRRLRLLGLSLPASLASMVESSRHAWRGPAATDLEARLDEATRVLGTAAARMGAAAQRLERRAAQARREAADLEQQAARTEQAAAVPAAW